MGGSDGGVIIRNLKTAAGLSLSKSGKVKVWHGLLLTHLLVFLSGKFF